MRVCRALLQHASVRVSMQACRAPLKPASVQGPAVPCKRAERASSQACRAPLQHPGLQPAGVPVSCKTRSRAGGSSRRGTAGSLPGPPPPAPSQGLAPVSLGSHSLGETLAKAPVAQGPRGFGDRPGWSQGGADLHSSEVPPSCLAEPIAASGGGSRGGGWQEGSLVLCGEGPWGAHPPPCSSSRPVPQLPQVQPEEPSSAHSP